MNESTQTPTLGVAVWDSHYAPVTDATVTVRSDGGGEAAVGVFDEKSGTYRVPQPRGKYLIVEVHHHTLESQQKKINALEHIGDVGFILGMPGSRYITIHGSRIPIHEESSEIGFTPAAGHQARELESVRGEVQHAVRELVGTPEAKVMTGSGKIAEKIGRIELATHRAGPKQAGRKGARGEVLRMLRRSELVEHAGPIVIHFSGEISIITDLIWVRFKDEVPPQRAEALLNQEHLTVRGFHEFFRRYECEADPSIGLEINEVIDRLLAHDEVVEASVQTAEPAPVDAINPGDFLWNALWDRRLIGLPDAWQILNDRIHPTDKYGDTNVVIAVYDGGIKSTGGIPDNEDFRGTIASSRTTTIAAGFPAGPPGLTIITVMSSASFRPGMIISIGALGGAGTEERVIKSIPDGTHIELTQATTLAQGLGADVHGGGAKVHRLYDFINLVPNNDLTVPTPNYGIQYHGVDCASVASGKADNVLAGRVIGVVGSAPNARLMGMRSVGGEANSLEALLWMAGLNAASLRAGFPATIDRGADIITCSLGLGFGAPLSAAAILALGRIVRRGRFGRGTMMFFSAGNFLQNANINTARPYGSHPMTFSCAASTLDQNGLEIKAGYSNYGNVQWCAPSHRFYDTEHNPPTNYNVLAASVPGNGNLPQAAEKTVTLTALVAATTTTTLTAAAAAGAPTLTVNNIATFANGDWIWVGYQGEDNGEWVQINAAPFGTTLPISGTAVAHAIGHQVHHSSTINVANTGGDPHFSVGRWILLGNPGDAGYEPVIIRNVISNTQYDVSGPMNQHGIGTNVIGGPNNHHDGFGGTSSATPLTAGTAGLLLSIRPTLTWAEVRDIFWRTARKFDIGTTGYPAPVFGGDPPQFTGRWQDQAGNFIVDTAGILQLPLGSATTSINNAAGYGPSAAAVSMKVAASAGFAVGDAVLLDTQASATVEVARVTARPDATHITVASLAQHHNNGVQVAKCGNSLQNAAAATNTTITVVNASYFTKDQAIQIGNFGDPNLEMRVVLGIAGNVISLDALTSAHGVGTVVLGGRIVFRSDWYGHGRINAAAAVQAAWDYNHNDRDLMIRSYGADTGTAAVPAGTAVASPDIWIRNTNPTVDLWNALPTGYPIPLRGPYTPDAVYNAQGPHQNPAAAADRWIYVRIKNRGTTLTSLDAWARIHIYRHATIATFNVTPLWNDTLPIAGAGGIISNGNGPYYVAERPLFNAAADQNIPALTGGTGGIPPGDHFIVKAQWNTADSPPGGLPIASRLRTFVIAEITPHDGALADGQIGRDNNITHREISFAAVTIKQTSVLPFPAKFEVPRAGDVATQPFRIEIADPIGFFGSNFIEVTVTRRELGGAETAVTFTYAGGPPAWAPDPVGQAWLTVGAPNYLTGGSAGTAIPAGTNLIDAYIEGTFDASKVHDKVTIRVRLISPEGAVILEQSQSLTVEELAVHYQNLEINSPERPDIHFFTDPANLVQTDALAFGPKSDTVYRLTSSFTYSGTGAPRCYAAATGLLMVQRIFDITGAADPCRVNVIIKPLRQTALGFTPVKYFIYRGVNLEDLLTSDATKVRDKNLAGGSPFITEFYDFLQERIDDFDASPLATSRPALRPNPQPTSVAFGWDSARPVADPVSKYFHDNGTAFQLPLIVRGTDFGSFFVSSATDEFGFEIVMEGEYEPSLGDVRTIANVLDITTLVAANPPAFDLKWKKETILSYLDPAAYYGMHWKLGVYTRQAPATTSSRTKETDLYNDVIAKFATKNVVWFDLRNENGYSYNYYDNVNPGSDQLMIGITMDAMCSMPYATSGWPIVQFKRTGAEVTASFGGIEYISIYSGDNLSPLIYIARGTSKTPVVNDAFITQEVLGSGDNRWMCEIALQFQTVADTGGTLYDVADIVRLHVGRPIDTTTTWGNNSVVRTLAYTDNLFGPVNAAKIWNVAANVQTEWLSLNDRRVVDGHRIEPTQPFIETVERGVAFQTDQVIFFAASVAYLKTTAASVPLGKGAVGGFSPKGSFIEGAALFDGFQLDSRKIQDTPPGAGAPIDVNILTLVPRDGTSLPEGFLLLAIKNSDLTSLVTAATAQLSPDHEMNLVLEEQFPGGGGNFSFAGKNYHRYLVKVRGLGITSFQNTDVVPGAGSVYVYSDDGLFFATPAIDITKIVPPTYTPDPEEQRAIDRPEPKALIDVDNTMSTTLSGFVSGVSNSAIPDDASAKTALQGEIETFGLDAWQAAKTYTSGGVPDDRPLYWARLRMMAALKRHNHMLSNAADRDALVKLLEWTTRGFTEVRYSGTGVPAGAVGAKKILVSGFDPFQLPADINRTNPSGVIALALDGFLADDGNGHKGYVQSVIFPVRYRDFDAGMLDEFFKEYLYGPDKVDMIITMSQNGGSPYFDIERFAGRTRGGFPDNVDAKLSGPVGSGTGWKEFFETTLPVTPMMSRVTIGTGQGVYFDQSYSLKKNNGSTVTLNHPTAASNASPNQKQKDNSIDVKTGVKSAIEGSGGDYLSNEIFYRVAHLRDVKPAGQSAKSTVKYGHLHVPGSAWTNADMIQKVKDLITDALSGL